MSDEIKVAITKKDFAESPGYDSPQKCPLANALNRQLEEQKGEGMWRVAMTHARLYPKKEDGQQGHGPHTTYFIPTTWGRREIGFYRPDKINNIIEAAKAGDEVPEVTLVLKKVD